jgi:hypothetical protein
VSPSGDRGQALDGVSPPGRYLAAFVSFWNEGEGLVDESASFGIVVDRNGIQEILPPPQCG